MVANVGSIAVTGSETFERLGPNGRSPIAACADHAGNSLPPDLSLGIGDDVLDQHVAVDLGVRELSQCLAGNHNIPVHVAKVSRLVVDLHRREDDPAVMPETSDGIAIPGNEAGRLEDRLARFHRPYHAGLENFIEDTEPDLLLALHSFTPRLKTSGEKRPWEVGLLYNNDDRAARHAIRLFKDMGFTVGDNEPYSGKQFNATMDRHAETRRIPYLTIEVRQDLVTSADGQSEWADRIAQVARQTLAALKAN